MDDPDWTDLGLGPWVALIHQSLTGGSGNSAIGMQEVASDSVFLVPASESDEVRIMDPSGAPFQRLERDPDGWRAGPFDRLGLYRIDRNHGNNRDTSWLAVGLAKDRMQPDKGARDHFLSSLGELRSKVAIRDAGDDLRGLYGGFRLRTWMLIAAALLLFLEGKVSLRLRPKPFDANARVTRRD